VSFLAPFATVFVAAPLSPPAKTIGFLHQSVRPGRLWAILTASGKLLPFSRGDVTDIPKPADLFEGGVL
jgi:hypothetical protein